jgi:hypothetical protein
MADPEPIPLAVLAGVRAGDPAAMADLCADHGGAVLAFCDAACGAELAPRAAAEAFARFRAAVAPAQDPGALDADALLLGATRHAAASLAPVAPGGGGGGGRLLGRGRRGSEVHPVVPTLLAARAAGALGQADQDRLARHLERCSSCRDVEQRFATAERRYAGGDPQPPHPELAGALVASMAAAAPPGGPSPLGVLGEEPAANADDPHDDPEAQDAAGSVDAGDEEHGDDGWTDEHDLPPFDDETHGPGITAAALGTAGVVAVDPDPELDHLLDDAQAYDDDDETDPGIERAAPIPIRGHPQATAPATAAVGRRLGRPLAILLPVAVVLLGAVAAMAVAGVFGGDDTQPARSGLDAPAPTTVRAPVTTPLPLSDARDRAAVPARKRKRPARTLQAPRTATLATPAQSTTPATTPATTPLPPAVTTPAATPAPTRRRSPTPAPAPPRKQSATKVTQDSGGQSTSPEPATETTPTFQAAPPAP